MVQRAGILALAPLALTAGEGRRIDDLEVVVDPLELGGETYTVPDAVPVRLDLSRMVGGGWALRLRFTATLDGPCMRCLGPARPEVSVDAREVHEDGEAPELRSPYVDGDRLDLRAWARDALVLALPAQLLCAAGCAGLCPECGADLNAEPDHAHEAAPDPRWAKLRELRFDQR
jgi:uncharacterized protein